MSLLKARQPPICTEPNHPRGQSVDGMVASEVTHTLSMNMHILQEFSSKQAEGSGPRGPADPSQLQAPIANLGIQWHGFWKGFADLGLGKCRLRPGLWHGRKVAAYFTAMMAKICLHAGS